MDKWFLELEKKGLARNIYVTCYNAIRSFYKANYVEMVAVMAKYNPFAEKGGLTKTVEQPPPKEALKIAGTLENLGFNIQLLGSENYNITKLQSLRMNDVEIIREAFIKQLTWRKIKFSCRLYIKCANKNSLRPENDDINQIVTYALKMDTKNAFLVYPSTTTETVDLQIGGIRVRNLVFDISQNPEKAGHIFVDRLSTYINQPLK